MKKSYGVPYHISFATFINLIYDTHEKIIDLNKVSEIASQEQILADISLLLDDEDEQNGDKSSSQVHSRWIRLWLERIKTEGAFYTLFGI